MLDLCITKLQQRAALIATAESCTGGLIASALTQKAGSSAWFDQGWVVYTADAKHRQLQVPNQLMQTTTVSKEVALAMAQGGLKNSNAHLCVSVTGVAGPSGGDGDHPVGCCWFGFALGSTLAPLIPVLPKTSLLTEVHKGSLFAARMDFKGDRDQVRASAVTFALAQVAVLIGSDEPVI